MSLHTTSGNTRTPRGFSLIEVLVAVLVLSFTLVGVTSLVTRTLDVSVESQRNLNAAKIAAEGLEIIRVRRDNNMLLGVAWNDGIDASMVLEPTAITGSNDTRPGFAITPQNGPPRVLCVHRFPAIPDAGKFTYQNCNDPNSTDPLPGDFTRTVRIEPINAYSVAVSSEVTFRNSAGQQRSFVLNSTLFETL